MRQVIATLLGATALSAAFILGAFAADMPAPGPVYKAPVAVVPYNWSGVYVGGHVGYGWMNSTDHVTAVNDAAGFIAGNDIATSLPLDPKGFVGGGQIGYNWQAPGSMWVWGFEADISGMDLSKTVSLPGPADATRIMTAQEKLDWLGTVRGRVGWTPVDRWLVYATGGLAYGHGSLSTALTRTSGCPGNNCESGSVSDTRAGWTVGGGLDLAITGNWIGRVEYLYYDLGNLSHLMTDPRPAFTSVFDASANLKGSLALASLIYKF